MNDFSENDANKEVNESQFFEENDLYISGVTFKKSLTDINDDFDNLEKYISKEKIQDIEKELLIDDIKINSLEQDVENIISETNNSISEEKHKKLFILKNLQEEESNNNKDNISNTNENNNNNNKPNSIKANNENEYYSYEESHNNKGKKINYLRNEAKVLEETISKLDLPNYQNLKKQKFKGCELNSLIFFKNSKKEIGKENNYIFNYRDNFLNDMTKIDQLFFKDYFKPKEHTEKDKNNKNINLVYEFSIYHPIKNVKTQQIAILGTGTLKQFKDKIYCVLDEIQSDLTRSFFFIEKVFYDDIPKKNKNDYIEPLSLKISELRLQKLSLKEFQHEANTNNIINNENKKNDNNFKNYDSKFIYYDKKLYCDMKSLIMNNTNSYESLNMNNIKIESIPFRIGYPYIFRHIESCDHVIILNDIRTVDKYDNFKEKDNNAIVTYQKKLKRKKCDACKFYYAKFISINDIVMGDVCHALFLCDYCLRKLHDSELKDNNTSNLKVIPYFHN